MNLAPIVLFTYNRLEHTRKTLKALSQNDLASKSDLFIYSDGPKTLENEADVKAVREHIKGISGFKSVAIVERDENWGLARSIISGVSEIVDRYSRVIVLEDDLVTSVLFLKYMNDALNFYAENEKVMHVAGYMLPVDNSDLPQTFFYKPTSCWGWGTWKRSWDFFEYDLEKLALRFTREMKKEFNLNGAYDFWSHIDMNLRGQMHTWAIRWYASVFVQNGFSLHPAKSLVENIGHDSSGVHCVTTEVFRTELGADNVTFFPERIEENKKARALIESYYRRNSGFRSRLLSKLKKIFSSN